MKIKEIIKEKLEGFAIYFDYTGAGRGPEQIAGPFDTTKQAERWAKANGIDLTDKDYFIDVVRPGWDETTESITEARNKWYLSVEYNVTNADAMDMTELDSQIKHAVGRGTSEGGFLFPTRTRDLGWVFADERSANAAETRVKKLSAKLKKRISTRVTYESE